MNLASFLVNCVTNFFFDLVYKIVKYLLKKCEFRFHTILFFYFFIFGRNTFFSHLFEMKGKKTSLFE
jgi:hypothetical protein